MEVTLNPPPEPALVSADITGLTLDELGYLASLVGAGSGAIAKRLGLKLTTHTLYESLRDAYENAGREYKGGSIQVTKRSY